MYLRHYLKLFGLILLVSGASAQDIKVKVFQEFSELEEIYFNKSDNIVHVINFWATWCKPCVKELPYIDALSEKFKNEVKVTLVSLDFPRKMETKLKPYIIQNKVRSEVVLLDDGKVNEWIDKVDPSWSGAIPATVIFYNGKKLFFEKEFHSMAELEDIILEIKNNN
jgi:thiol-disulfide isomerase/thioredoxin